MFNANVGKLNIQITGDSSNFNAAMKNLDTKVGKADQAVKRNTKNLKKWNIAAKYATVGGATLLTAQMIKISDAATAVSNKIRITTQYLGEFETTNRRLFEVANDTRSSIEATTDLYTKLERSTRTLGLSQTELFSITESINKSFGILGATGQESAGAIRQFAQALSKGVLNGDEFNSIAEQAPIILEAIMKETGKTVGELKKMGEQGTLTADILVKSLQKYKDAIDKDYSNAQRTFSQSIEVARNNAIKFAQTSETIQSAVSAFGDGLVFISENLDTVGAAATAAASVFAVKTVASYTSSAIAGSAYVATLNAVVGSHARVTTTARAAAVSVNFLGKAMRFAAGPIGLAVTAIAALAISMSDSETQAEKLQRKIEEVSDTIGGMNEQELELDVQNTVNKIQDLNQQLIKLTDRYNQLSDKARLEPRYKAFADRVKQDIDKVNELLLEMDARQQAAFKRRLELQQDAARKEEAARNEAARESREAIAEELELQVKMEQEAYKKRIEEDKRLYNEKLKNAQSVLDRIRENMMTEDALTDEKYARDLEKLRWLHEQKKITDAEYQIADLAAKQQYEDEKTRIEQEAADERARIAMQEMRNKFAIANGLLALGEIFGSKSEKQTKKNAKRQAMLSGAEAAVHAWNQGMKDGGPWVAAAYTAISLKNTKRMIDSIGNSGSSSSSGGYAGGASQNQQSGGSTGQDQQRPVSIISNVNATSLYDGQTVRDLMMLMAEQAGDNFNVSFTNDGGG